MTRIVAFSDTHGQHKAKPINKWMKENPADILLFAGDLQLNHYDDGGDFIDWLGELPYYKNKIIVFGNHDGNYEIASDLAKDWDDITILNNESITINGIKIWGSPYSVTFGDWWFMKSDKELEEIYNRVPIDTNILLTHTPPMFILDEVISGVAHSGTRHAGSASLHNRLFELPNLKYHFFGHIHEGNGQEYINNISFCNVSVLDEKYRLEFGPRIFEY